MSVLASRGFWVACGSLVLACQGVAADTPSAKDLEFFEKKIRPVLVQQCYKCHSTEAGKPKGGLLVDSRDGLLKGGETGPAVVPGSPDDSLLIDAIRHDGLEMPPERKLPDNVIADFVQWVKLGAPDPRTGKVEVAKKTIDIEEGRKFWAFQSPVKKAPPKTKNGSWARDDVDRFVLAALESQGLKPVADADRRVLIRRLYFDLVGLPPSPAEVDAFVADKSPKAVESLVDKLLASPQFGERWGRHWLDVARFAESNGNADNVIFGEAWRYRDYVISALNNDKPFDRFIVEQVAGDLLAKDLTVGRDELLIATGFLALGSKPRPQNNPDFQMDVVAEQIEVTTSGFMALTVACARCHDHKFDPIPTKEYYAMAGIFTSTQALYGSGGRRGGNSGLHALTGTGDAVEARKKHDEQVATARKQQSEMLAQLEQMGARMRPDKPNKNKPNKPNKKNQPDEDGPVFRAPKNSTADEQAKIDQLVESYKKAGEEIKKLEENVPSAGEAMGVRDGKAGDCQICIRGESQKRGESVPRGFVSVVNSGPLPQIDSKQSGRLELAQWIASRENPLTSRVIANRIWRHLFGRGIVPSVDNFGVLGEKPSHPELLDYLAVKFVDDGWSIKKAIRHLVLTRTYALSSNHDTAAYEKDPDNVYLWRHSPRRLDAESLRDAILAVSGKLSPDPLHGSMVSKFAGQDLKGGKIDLKGAADAKGQYRSVYLPIIRNGLPEMLDLFDVADPSLVVGNRDVTTIPAQSLYLMNSPFLVQSSRAMADRVLAEANSDTDRVSLAFRLAVSRSPTPAEQARTAELLEKARGAYSGKSPSDVDSRCWSAFCQALLASAEFRYVE